MWRLLDHRKFKNTYDFSLQIHLINAWEDESSL